MLTVRVAWCEVRSMGEGVRAVLPSSEWIVINVVVANYCHQVAEELHAHRHAARLVCKQQRAATLERQPDRCAILCQNGTRGSRVFARWIWRGLALLASYRLRTGVGRAKTMMRRWGYLDDAQSVDCDCGEPQTMAHLLSCRLLDEACTADDLPQLQRGHRHAPASGRTLCEGHERRRRLPSSE